MTNKEAIKKLKEFKILHTEQTGWDTSTLQALDIAIKALEQEPCEDCISRAEVRRVLGNEVFELMKVSRKDNPKVDAKIGGINWSLNTIMELPSVTPKGVTITEFADRCRECGREKVLDKIRAEIRELATFDTVDVLVEVNRIIDKYRTESEEV